MSSSSPLVFYTAAAVSILCKVHHSRRSLFGGGGSIRRRRRRSLPLQLEQTLFRQFLPLFQVLGLLGLSRAFFPPLTLCSLLPPFHSFNVVSILGDEFELDDAVSTFLARSVRRAEQSFYACYGGVLDAEEFCFQFGFSLELSPDTNIEATFTPDGKYVVAVTEDCSLYRGDSSGQRSWKLGKDIKITMIVTLSCIAATTHMKGKLGRTPPTKATKTTTLKSMYSDRSKDLRKELSSLNVRKSPDDEFIGKALEDNDVIRELDEDQIKTLLEHG
ncbi:hypothetical protein RIF29_37916 [Crotalaria pallida]|uniref:Uncharacterized protein n=1 Tax=Crotalaria pallida TaxID=3830 RepID=A0AAN9E3R7_CROPI